MTAQTKSSDVKSGAVISNAVYSMTGFARAAGTTPAGATFTLSLKSVNHRFLDLQFHLPNGMDALEMQWRALLKQHIARGHVDVRLSLHRSADVAASSPNTPRVNAEILRGYIDAFRAAAADNNVVAEPDLNQIFRLPGVWSSGAPDTDIHTDKDARAANEAAADAATEAAIAAAMPALLASLNEMRAQEGLGLVEVLQACMATLDKLVAEAVELRAGIQDAHRARLEQRIGELLSGPLDRDRILQEAALLADRSDVAEEMARLRVHIQHFLDLLRAGGEVGKKLDFLLQEMSREANTLLSKTGGIAGKTLRLTELGLAMKTEIEKAREQIQNIE